MVQVSPSHCKLEPRQKGVCGKAPRSARGGHLCLAGEVSGPHQSPAAIGYYSFWLFLKHDNALGARVVENRGGARSPGGPEPSAHAAYQSQTPTGLAGTWSISFARRKQGRFSTKWQLSVLQNACLLCRKALCARRCHTKECSPVPPALPALLTALLTFPSTGCHSSREHCWAALPSWGPGKPPLAPAAAN